MNAEKTQNTVVIAINWAIALEDICIKHTCKTCPVGISWCRKICAEYERIIRDQELGHDALDSLLESMNDNIRAYLFAYWKA